MENRKEGVSLIYQTNQKQQIMTTKSIKTLTTRMITDSNCVLKAELLEIKGNFAIIYFDGKVSRKKIHTSYDGSKYIFPCGKYSMCPTFDI